MAEMNISSFPRGAHSSLLILLCWYWRGIRIGCSHLAWRKSIVPALWRWPAATREVDMNWNSYILHVSVRLRGRWAHWPTVISDRNYWPLDPWLNSVWWTCTRIFFIPFSNLWLLFFVILCLSKWSVSSWWSRSGHGCMERTWTLCVCVSVHISVHTVLSECFRKKTAQPF